MRRYLHENRWKGFDSEKAESLYLNNQSIEGRFKDFILENSVQICSKKDLAHKVKADDAVNLVDLTNGFLVNFNRLLPNSIC